MYNHYFGFRERPFKLVPDPDYLFLSRSHEEALAHLRYAINDGEGFVEIIGEIGTGKTMLCRKFLGSLDDVVESAYVFNPRLDALDLLKAVLDEFGIPVPAPQSIKALIDGLNVFLMEKKAAGKKVLLVIDEAQNLSLDVLEQIRLLSNLETTKDKLLQILLVGQPELSAMLDHWGLRQLRQRISLRCRLNPLTAAETRGYITHRLKVASRGAQNMEELFSNSALRRIYRFSKGIPRLINMACDRALLAAYARDQPFVSGGLAAAAIRELSGGQSDPRHSPGGFRSWLPALSVGFFVACLGLLLAVGYFNGTVNFFSSDADSADAARTDWVLKTPVREISSPVSSVPAVSESTADNAMEMGTPILSNAASFSKPRAFASLLKQWGIGEPVPVELPGDLEDAAYFSASAHSSGLSMIPVDDDLERILRLNVPAILKCRYSSFHSAVYSDIAPVTDASADPPVYLTLIRATSTCLVFSGLPENSEFAIPYARMPDYWTGRAFVFWNNFYHYPMVIPTKAPGEALITLKLHLRDMGYPHLGISGRFDLATQMVIKAIQARHGIPVDGYVGPLTQIVLYNDMPSLVIPHLWPDLSLPAEVFGKHPQQTDDVQSPEPRAYPMGARP